MAEHLNFITRYSSFCLDSKVYPLKSVIRHVKGSELAIPVESVRPDHWMFLLSALFNDNSLTKVHFASCVSPHKTENDSAKLKRKRDKAFPAPYGRSEPNIRNMTIAIAGLLHTSEFLVILKLENLSLKLIDAQHLATGLSKAILKVLSLSGCHFEEGSVDAICNGLQLSSIAWVDFSNCDLNIADIESICKVIKTHKLKRSNEIYEKTLRYREAVLDEMEGLNRLSLSYNFIQNSGVAILVESLADDFWIKALDLQHCGIEDEGAELLLKATMTNAILEVIDLRLNLIDYGLVQRIEQQLTLNKSGKTIKYFPMPLWEPSELVRRYASVRKGKVVKKKLPIKVKLIKKVKSLKSLNNSVRATVRVKTVAVKDACVQTEDMVFCSGVPKNMQDIFNNLRSKLAFETKLRKFFMQKYYSFKDENEQLRELLMKTQNDDIYIDQETYSEIKQTFEKLKIFFDVMKKYGLWEYIAVLGFDDASEVVITELDDQKCVKVKRKEQDPAGKASSSNQEVDEDDSELVINAELVLGENSCCNCKKTDPNQQVAGPAKQADVVHNCLNSDKSKLSGEADKVTKDDDMLNEKLAINKLFQEVMENFSGEIHASSKSENAKPPSCKQLDGKAVSCAQMFMKKFSYSNMPKKVKELVTPTEFYKLLKRELERYDDDIMKPACGRHESSSQTVESGGNVMPSQPQPKRISVKKAFKSVSSSISNDTVFKPSTSEYVPQSKNQKDSQKNLKEQLAMSDDYDDISISELIARKKALSQASPKYVPTKKETAKSSNSSSSNAKAKNSKVKSQNKASEKQFRLPPGAEPMASLQEKLSKSNRTSSSTQTVKIPQTNKNTQSTTHASSDEINSSDSVVTASDKMSDSSVSSSYSERSLVKNSSDQNESEQHKSYIESVSSASTFKDVESISDIEVVSRTSSLNEIERDKNEPKNHPNASPTKAESISSSSSAKKSSKSKKSGKKAQTVIASTSSSTLKDAPESKIPDKPVNTSAPVQGKGKKQSGKNRPKGSSKSSSVPSLSDITTVSSQSLNTDSIMKQISGSENDAKSEK